MLLLVLTGACVCKAESQDCHTQVCLLTVNAQLLKNALLHECLHTTACVCMLFMCLLV
jgi:hypothetical protein